jgi:hypothetical protein
VYDDIVARGRRGTRRVVLVAIVAVAFAGAIGAAVVHWVSEPFSGDTAPPEAATMVDQLSPAVAVDMPDDLEWADVAGVALPVSLTIGPWDTSNGLARGYAREPAGAVLAAANIVVRINPQLGPNVFGPTLEYQVTGSESPALRARVESVYETLLDQLGLAYGQPAGRLYATLIGFRVDRYSDTDVTLRLLAEGPDNRGGTLMSSLRIELSWTSQGWALVAPKDGDFGPAGEVVDSAESYTRLRME